MVSRYDVWYAYLHEHLWDMILYRNMGMFVGCGLGGIYYCYDVCDKMGCLYFIVYVCNVVCEILGWLAVMHRDGIENVE